MVPGQVEDKEAMHAATRFLYPMDWVVNCQRRSYFSTPKNLVTGTFPISHCKRVLDSVAPMLLKKISTDYGSSQPSMKKEMPANSIAAIGVRFVNTGVGFSL